MPPKKERLTKKEFSEVFEKGDRIKKSGFLFVLSACKVGGEKVSVACSKKVDAKAVARNKKKRRIYNCLKNNKDLWKGRGYNLIVVAQLTKANRPYNTLCGDLLDALGEIMITE